MNDATIVGRAEIHDNWYVISDPEKGHAIGIGVYLPPPWAPVRVEKVQPDIARKVAEAIIEQTIGPNAAGFFSCRVASNNRLLMVGRWEGGEGVSGIQFDRLMPDQTRELLGELIVRSEGPSLVGVIEIKG